MEYKVRINVWQFLMNVEGDKKVKTEMVIENLKDAGCNISTIEKFMDFAANNKKKKQLEILEKQRSALLKRIHKDEKRISCLDYLVYQINRDHGYFLS